MTLLLKSLPRGFEIPPIAQMPVGNMIGNLKTDQQIAEIFDLSHAVSGKEIVFFAVIHQGEFFERHLIELEIAGKAVEPGYNF